MFCVGYVARKYGWTGRRVETRVWSNHPHKVVEFIITYKPFQLSRDLLS